MTMTSKLNREGNTDQGFSMTFKDRQSGSFQGRISGVEEVVVRSRVTAEAAWCHVAPGPGLVGGLRGEERRHGERFI